MIREMRNRSHALENAPRPAGPLLAWPDPGDLRFGLLICQGMVDEMRHNEQGNEVTLIKRFAPCKAS